MLITFCGWLTNITRLQLVSHPHNVIQIYMTPQFPVFKIQIYMISINHNLRSNIHLKIVVNDVQNCG